MIGSKKMGAQGPLISGSRACFGKSAPRNNSTPTMFQAHFHANYTVRIGVDLQLRGRKTKLEKPGQKDRVPFHRQGHFRAKCRRNFG
jgi:hypothetical protein